MRIAIVKHGSFERWLLLNMIVYIYKSESLLAQLAIFRAVRSRRWNNLLPHTLYGLWTLPSLEWFPHQILFYFLLHPGHVILFVVADWHFFHNFLDWLEDFLKVDYSRSLLSLEHTRFHFALWLTMDIFIPAHIHLWWYQIFDLDLWKVNIRFFVLSFLTSHSIW